MKTNFWIIIYFYILYKLRAYYSQLFFAHDRLRTVNLGKHKSESQTPYVCNTFHRSSCTNRREKGRGSLYAPCLFVCELTVQWHVGNFHNRGRFTTCTNIWAAVMFSILCYIKFPSNTKWSKAIFAGLLYRSEYFFHSNDDRSSTRVRLKSYIRITRTFYCYFVSSYIKGLDRARQFVHFV